MKISSNRITGILLGALILFVLGRYFYMKPRFINGEKTPDFTVTTLGGEQMPLSFLRGNLVLLDFWGSWCGPCRAENPGLVAVYKKYQGKTFRDAGAFHIVSIGIEDREDRWRKAIDRDGLSWPYHVLDLATSLRFFDSPVAKLYGIKQVPTKFLLNADGVIIAVDPDIGHLDQLLRERLAEQ